MHKGGYTYILTNITRTTLYVGVTSDLVQRIAQHKSHQYKNSFTSKYNVEYCIYYEEFPTIIKAINREKEIKKWSRHKKELLINKVNPEWLEIDFNQGKTKISFKDEVTKILDEILKENKEKE
ncbi:MAG TPA: GIY-YIG nuclease family protein [Saprospiraceae bacterium]|nr:GIY-YIG nuclease family protein [Saprospiraceae bacterium]